MNVILDNQFTKDMIALGKKLPVPDGIVVVSAHWLTRGTFITSSVSPEQIYDFYGFPPKLYNIIYRAPGSPVIAESVIKLTAENKTGADSERGIDHAAWTILKHIFPKADIPVLELSLDVTKPPVFHYELGRKLGDLRQQNVLVIGSGNIIHNLRDIDFNDEAKPFQWASDFDKIILSELIGNDFSRLIDYEKLGPLATRAIPYFDHYLPMLYILGMKGENDELGFIHESILYGSISMRSFVIGNL